MHHIRNFGIIAHVDHGKSTLADRLIQACGAIQEREMRDQILDSMDIERERGITIKSNSITLAYTSRAGRQYELNLIDTPGHVDFSHEVRRSLLACDGALLVVDATQGVEAQTVANLYLAMEYDLTLLPVINKIDLASADVERVREEIDADLGLDPFGAVAISAKNGTNIDEVLEAIVNRLPPPRGDLQAPLKALVFDAYYDRFRGVIVLCRVMDGAIRPGDAIRFMHGGQEFQVLEVGQNKLERCKTTSLSAGEVGYVIAGIKTIREIAVGDTITNPMAPTAEPVPGYKAAKPVVFSSIYPMEAADYPELTAAMEKLALSDAALVYQKDSSVALGFGFRCGFLGLLHLDVFQERLEREFDMSLVLSAPSVLYRVTLSDGTLAEIDNPTLWPDPGRIEKVEEPFIKAAILTPEKFMGPVMELCREYRAAELSMSYLAVGRIEVTSVMPLSDVLFDFNDRLKTVTRGYGSFDYEFLEYRPGKIVKVDILINKEKIDALAYLVHEDKARPRALHYCEQLAEAIPRHQFKIPIQGAIGSTIIARSTINPFRKDVTAKLYGGDITRKRKLLEKQKEGKKRMKLYGSVQVPQEAFVAVLRAEKDE
ncbi:MAG: elongation factor 4 [Candidatus Schekmanbacteria bacterium]|nr:elongation factor 4 [Candidatus Schekmanbacteria bacterium]